MKISKRRVGRSRFTPYSRENETFDVNCLSRSIGVSNYGVDELRTLLASAKIKPVVNQAEFYHLILTRIVLTSPSSTDNAQSICLPRSGSNHRFL